ncbi:MAG: ABC transporter permease, partial [Anaerolineae bacterium]|nr:ABC transporter permease [Anaerolineae bacterium]
MATIANKPSAPEVLDLAEDQQKVNKLWVDAWKRLIRNRAAVVGLIIVILSVFVAVFAPLIAPNDYRDQELTNNNSAPRWVI